MAAFRSRNRPDAAENPLVVRPGSTLKRDVYRAATAGVTGVTAFGALAVTGVVAGAAAHQQKVDEAAKAAQPAPATQVAPQRRKHRTIVKTRVVHIVSRPGVTQTGSGGTIRSSGSSGSGTTSHSSGDGAQSAPKPAAPKPAPAPAPSSGS